MPYHRLRAAVLVLVLVIVAARVEAASTGKFLTLSDIHLDTSYDPRCRVDSFCRACAIPLTARPMGQYGCDSPYPLLVSALSAAMEATNGGSELDFVILSGDSVAHKQSSWKDAHHTLENVTATIKSILPSDLPLFVSIGNEDVYPAYQLYNGPSKTLEDMYELWGGDMPAAAEATFLGGGYYAVSPNPSLQILFLNTLYYSKHWSADNETNVAEAAGRLGHHDDDPVDQFKWMETTLADARSRSQSVWIVSHIGPGAGRTFKHAWKDSYAEAYMDIIRDYDDVIKAQIFGHIHRDGLRMLFETDPDSPTVLPTNPAANILLNAAVTPVSQSNPSFRIVEYSPSSSDIVSYTQYYYDIEDAYSGSSEWEELYSFGETYGTKGINVESVYGIISKLYGGDKTLFDTWAELSYAHSGVAVIQGQQTYACAMVYVLGDNLDTCVKDAGGHSDDYSDDDDEARVGV